MHNLVVKFEIFSFDISDICFPCRSASGKIQMDAQSQKDFEAESAKLKKLYGGGDLTKFPEFQFKGEISRKLCLNPYVT